MKILVILLHLKDRKRQKFLLKLLADPKTDFFPKLIGYRKNEDEIIVKTQLKKIECPSELKGEEEIIQSFKGSEFKDQLSALKDHIFPLPENDEELRQLVAGFFTRPYEQWFDKMDDRDLLLMLDLFNVPMKDALAQPESGFGGQVVSTLNSRHKGL